VRRAKAEAAKVAALADELASARSTASAHRDETAKATAALKGHAKKLGVKHRKASESAAEHEESAAKMRKKARALLKAKKALEAAAAVRNDELDAARSSHAALAAQHASAEAALGALHAELTHHKGVLRPASEATVLRAVQWAASDPLGSLDEVIAAKRRFAALRKKGVPAGKAARKKQKERASEIEAAEKEHIEAFALALSSELYDLQSLAAAEAGTVVGLGGGGGAGGENLAGELMRLRAAVQDQDAELAAARAEADKQMELAAEAMAGQSEDVELARLDAERAMEKLSDARDRATARVAMAESSRRELVTRIRASVASSNGLVDDVAAMKRAVLALL
jgi:hypothetical protein